MTALFVRIRDIRAKAELSEKMVQEITRDIKSLDVAKKHITESIKSLNHLGFLLRSIDGLDEKKERGRYEEVSANLAGIKDVFGYFAKHADIDRIRELSLKVDSIKNSIAMKITSDFRKASASIKAELAPQLPRLKEACLVLDNLDPVFKTEQIDLVFLTLSRHSMCWSSCCKTPLPSWPLCSNSLLPSF